MEPETFTSSGGTDAQESFQRWQAGHPDGLYINRMSASEGMLHRVGCHHVGGADAWDSGFGDLANEPRYATLTATYCWAGL